ncbi:MAG: hypothetical protein ACQESB_03415, partial [Elusimicrobiota bacterium]
GIKSKIKINYKISSYDSQVSPVKDNDKGYTTWGPQRDRFEFKFDGAQVSRYASRGETRTAAFIYRMATLKMIARASEKSPLVLLDDVFSELDAGKRDAISKRLQGRQAILTHTEIPGELENRLSGVIKI